MVYNFCHCSLSPPQIFGTLGKREDSEIKKKLDEKRHKIFCNILFFCYLVPMNSNNSIMEHIS